MKEEENKMIYESEKILNFLIEDIGDAYPFNCVCGATHPSCVHH